VVKHIRNKKKTKEQPAPAHSSMAKVN